MSKFSTALFCFLLALAQLSCGEAMVKDPDPVSDKPKVTEPVAQEPDAFRDYRGVHYKANEKFRATHKPVAVDGAEVVITLIKTDWATLAAPNGKEIREASANLKVQKGQEERLITVAQGDDRVVFNARIKVVGAGEDYDKATARYGAWVELSVDKID